MKSDIALSLSIGERAHNTKLHPVYKTVLFWNATPITIGCQRITCSRELAACLIYKGNIRSGTLSNIPTCKRTNKQEGIKWTRDALREEVLEKIDVKWILSVAFVPHSKAKFSYRRPPLCCARTSKTGWNTSSTEAKHHLNNLIKRREVLWVPRKILATSNVHFLSISLRMILILIWSTFLSVPILCQQRYALEIFFRSFCKNAQKEKCIKRKTSILL